MAAEAEPGAVAGTGARENRAAGRAEPERNRDRREPELARVVWVFPAPPSEPVYGGGWLRAAPVAEPAAMAFGWRGQRDRSRPPTLAETMVCPLWTVVLGHGPRVDADNRTTTNPLTGEPDAGDPPVRFGGRGKVQTLVPTPIGCIAAAETDYSTPAVLLSAFSRKNTAKPTSITTAITAGTSQMLFQS